MAEEERNSKAPVPVPEGSVPVPAPVHLTPTTPGWTQYEVDVEIDPAYIEQFDAWLPDHVDEILKVPGFVHADILVRENVEDGPRVGWSRRIIQYKVRDEAQLQGYISEHRERIRAESAAKFGEHAWFERRVLKHSAHRTPGQLKLEYCSNCGSVLNGQYCASCGQRSQVRIISLWHLLKEAAEDISHLDSRLWRTMQPLLFKPGFLTNEYLAGRRARFIPPFRLYLALSIIFFLVTLSGVKISGFGQDNFDELTPAQQKRYLETLEELKKDGIEIPRPGQFKVPMPVPPTPPPKKTAQTPASSPAGSTAPAAESAAKSEAQRTTPPPGLTFSMDKCDDINITSPFEDYLEPRIREACRRWEAPGGEQRFVQTLINSIPKMMFVFLPLLALANKGLYPLSRRYYVEHLLFFVHFHAFVFTLFLLRSVFTVLTSSIAWLEWVPGLMLAAIVIYIPIYLFKAMRRVYRQGRLVTAFKFSLLYVAYLVCMTLTIVFMVLFTALTF